MYKKWMFRCALLVGFLGGCGLPAAAAPWDNLISLRSPDANPDQTYPVTENNGPWMILACSFSGEGAEKQAKELVYELRKRYKLPAYIHQAKFDLGDATGLGIDKYGKPKVWNYYKQQKRHVELEEVAVLVGDYRSQEDPEAKNVLRKIKYAQPECLEVKEGKTTHQSLTGWRMIQRQVYEAIGSERKKNGPMGHAFITTNPLLPPDYFAQGDGIDEAILAMNKGVPYSLLDCPGKYTVRVATFKAQVIIKQDEIKAIESGDREMESELPIMAEKADKLTNALRVKDYEAYQFHDRYGSIVTVGSFNSAGSPQTGQFTPEIQNVVNIFGAKTDDAPEPVQEVMKFSSLNGQAAAPVKRLVDPVKNLVGIAFDIQPTPVQVPKRSLSTAMRPA